MPPGAGGWGGNSVQAVVSGRTRSCSVLTAARARFARVCCVCVLRLCVSVRAFTRVKGCVCECARRTVDAWQRLWQCPRCGTPLEKPRAGPEWVASKHRGPRAHSEASAHIRGSAPGGTGAQVGLVALGHRACVGGTGRQARAARVRRCQARAAGLGCLATSPTYEGAMSGVLQWLALA